MGATVDRRRRLHELLTPTIQGLPWVFALALIGAIIGTVYFSWMQQLYDLLMSMTQLSPLAYVLVFAGGIASALSPCYVPVLAMFAGYIGGYTRGEKTGGGLHLAGPFVLGNAVTLALVGGAASLLSNSVLRLFTSYQLDRWIPGVLGLAMGLQLLGVLSLRMPAVPIFHAAGRPKSASASFVLGVPFGLVVTPCTIPIFFAVVAFVSFQGSVLHGATLMMAYAFGRGAILVAVAVYAGLLKAVNIGRTSWYVRRISGGLILAISIGLLLFYDSFVRFVGRWML